MSRFLKFIVHFVVICTIICVLGLALPPFWGITTVIMDSSDKATNLPVGSVTYAIPVKTEEVAIGTPILVQEDSKVYRYNIASLDLENHTGTVVDPTVSGSDTITVAVKNRVPKVVITIGYLGYLLVATQSIEGLIILGLVVLFLIILYVIAELWKKDPGDDYEDDDLEPGYVKSAKELKREEKAREKRMREEDRELLKGEKGRKKEQKKEKKKARKIVKTGGFVDEVYEDEDEFESEEQEERPVNVQAATSEAHELLKKEIAAATAEEPRPTRKASAKTRTRMAEELPKAKQPGKPVAEKKPEPVEIKKMAIPVWSAAQLADKAKREGDAPEIVRDSITKVTLFDYSDIIGGDDEEYEDEE